MDSTKAENAATAERVSNPRSAVTTFVVLTFLFSLPFWYLRAHEPAHPKDQTRGILDALATMWSPGLAAIVTRLWYQRNSKGMGFRLGKARWLILGMLMPVLAGLLMFGAAWIFGVAPLDPEGVKKVFSPRFIPIFIFNLSFGCFLALGEELGWRGLLVPELARYLTFTRVALVSGAIWTVWHFPLILFASYGGAGSLWYSLAMFIPLVMAVGFVEAWLRLASGSIWPAMLLHGFWNYFVQGIYPLLTQKTPTGEMMLGEFGWSAAVLAVIVGLVFWRLRNRPFEKIAH